jgi:4-hydroxy-3-polyprenylbenzoate decarboxylase
MKQNRQTKEASAHPPARLVVGITGASGIAVGVRLLELLKDTGVESHLVMSRAAEMALAYETDLSLKQVRALAGVHHGAMAVGASIASGSFHTMGMVIVPCSIRTMSEIATGVTSTLVSRAADVALKERRRLVLAIRETPLHLGHLRSMTALAEMGAVVAPLAPAFYPRPESVNDMVDHMAGRLLDLFDIETGAVRRWEGPK